VHTDHMSSMQTDSESNSARSNSADGSVNYDSGPLVELALDGLDYRLDAGKQGTALSISSRPSGSWDWSFCGEARWDGSSLRSRVLERKVLQALSLGFKQALADLE
jgi:hypothetical protein